MKTWTMADIRLRCSEEGKCLVWGAAVNNDGYPVAKVAGKATHMTRFVFTELLGKKLGAKQLVSTKCRNRACLSEDCLFATNKGAINVRSYADGSRNKLMELSTKRRVARERGVCILNDSSAEEIRRRKDERTDLLAAEFGVSKTTINKVKSGKIWNPVARGATAFNWMP